MGLDMDNSRHRAIRCEISRGGFSDERIFVIPIENGFYEGIASRRHMWTVDGGSIEEGEPPVGQKLEGLVAARVLSTRPGSGFVTVSVPDGEVVEVPVASLVNRPAGEHVSIRS